MDNQEEFGEVLDHLEENEEDETLYQRVLRIGRGLAMAMWEKKDRLALVVLLGGSLRNLDVVWGVTYKYNIFRSFSWHSYIFVFVIKWFDDCSILEINLGLLG